MDRRLAPLLLAEGVSKLGTQMSAIALPWFVLVTTGSPARMGFVLAAEVLGTALAGLPSGVLVARLGPRRTMLASDIARAPIVALVPALHLVDALSLPVLLAVAFALGAFTAPYFASQRLVLPELLGDDERLVGRANSLVEGTTRLMGVVGPAVAGVLIGLLGATNVLWLDAGSFVVSFALLLPLSARGGRDAGVEPARGLLAGIRVLLADPLLRGISASVLLFGAVFPVLFATLPVLALTRYDGDARVVGWLFAAWGVGAVLGSAIAFRATSRWPPIGLATVGVAGAVVPLWALPADLPAVGVGVVLTLSAVFVPLANAPLMSVLTLRTPPGARAKVMTALLTAEGVAGPAAYATAGPTLERFGLGPAYWYVALGATAAACVFIVSTRSVRAAERRRRRRGRSPHVLPVGTATGASELEVVERPGVDGPFPEAP